VNAHEIVWVQEEPKNMGAYRFVEPMVRERLDLELPYVGREMRATPAVASEKMHKQEQTKILITAVGLPNDAPSSTSPDGGRKKPLAAKLRMPRAAHR
jgi:hypothetical protein